jgi:TetR/AcrR family transcriptional regulator
MARTPKQQPSSSLSQEEESEGPSRRDRILQVATEHFALKGFAAVRIDEIAKASDCNKQLIYYYFGSKAGLYDAVLSDMIQGMAPAWAEMESHKLEDTAGQFLSSASGQNAKYWRRLLVWEGIEHSVDGNSEIRMEAARTKAWHREIEIVRRAQSQGDLRADMDPAMVALFIAMMTMGPHALPQITKMLTGEDAGSENFAKRRSVFAAQLIQALRP